MQDHRDSQARQRSRQLAALLLVMLGAALTGTAFAAAPNRSTALTGDAVRGRALFMGEVHFQNGGPPCMGCHNVGTNGLLGGGALGPDLTDVSTRFESAVLAENLAAMKMPTMKPIFADHPLTAQEQADLLAFLQASAGEPKANREGVLFALSLVGLAAVAASFGFLYRHRLRGVRRSLVARARVDGNAQ